MAGTMKYFSGRVEVESYGSIDNAKFAAAFPGIKGIRNDSFTKRVGRTADKSIVPLTRIIEYKTRPSLHQCDARCLNATGRLCECSCGGKNHGMNG